MRKMVSRWETGITACWCTLIWTSHLLLSAAALNPITPTTPTTTPKNITHHVDDSAVDIFKSNSNSTHIQLLSPVSDKVRRVDGGCQRFLHCQNQMMTAYRRCTMNRQRENNNNTSDPNCSIRHKMSSLHQLIDLRLQEHVACVEKLSGEDLAHRRLDGESTSCRVPITPKNLDEMQCWRAIFIAHRQCKALRRCCPQANVCMREQQASPLVRRILHQQADLRSQIEECRAHVELNYAREVENVTTPFKLLKRWGKHTKARQHSNRTLRVHDINYQPRRVFQKNSYRARGRLFANDRWEWAKVDADGRRSRGKKAKKSLLDSELGWVPSRLGIWPYRGHYDTDGFFREDQGLVALTDRRMGRVLELKPIRQRQSFTLPSNFNLTSVHRARAHLSPAARRTHKLHGAGFWQSPHVTPLGAIVHQSDSQSATSPKPPPKWSNTNTIDAAAIKPVPVEGTHVASELVKNLEEFVRRRLKDKMRRRNHLHGVKTRPVLKTIAEQDGDLIGLLALEHDLNSISRIPPSSTTKVRRPLPYSYYSPHVKNIRVFEKKDRRIYAADKSTDSRRITNQVAANKMLDSENPRPATLLANFMQPTLNSVPHHLSTPRPKIKHPTLITTSYRHSTPRPTMYPTLVMIPLHHQSALTAAPKSKGRSKATLWHQRALSHSGDVHRVDGEVPRSLPVNGLVDGGEMADVQQPNRQRNSLLRHLKISKMGDRKVFSSPSLVAEKVQSNYRTLKTHSMVSGDTGTGDAPKEREEEGLVEFAESGRRGPLEVIPVESTLVASDLVMNLEEFMRRHNPTEGIKPAGGEATQSLNEPNPCDLYALCADRLRETQLKCDATAVLKTPRGATTGPHGRCRPQVIHQLALIDKVRKELGRSMQECLRGRGEPIDNLVKAGIGFRNFVDRYFGKQSLTEKVDERGFWREGSCDSDHLADRREACDAIGRRCGPIDGCRSQKSMLARRLRIEEERLEGRTKLCRQRDSMKISRASRRVRI